MLRTIKGFDPDMTSIFGNDRTHFEVGRTETVDECKTHRIGFHSSENIFVCFKFYQYDGKNIFAVCDAGGDINEEDGGIVSSTSIRPVRILSAAEVLGEAVFYVVRHPDEMIRENRGLFRMGSEISVPANGIGIARGVKPVASGKKGSCCALLREDANGVIESLRVFKVGKEYAEDVRYTLVGDDIVEVMDEDK